MATDYRTPRHQTPLFCVKLGSALSLPLISQVGPAGVLLLTEPRHGAGNLAGIGHSAI
jgi:hypothetical protein